MKINLLGAGRVAWHLAPSLQRAGHQVVGICARHLEHAQALASRLTDALAVTSVGQLPAADWYLLSVSDASIAPLAAELAALPLP
ncbi:MAG: NAD(P)-binding domain-containing protein, partial [Bacteroidales bacterium]|nr:NAD(P)-binding domain-containing protein [Bacteroidales bacterium]